MVFAMVILGGATRLTHSGLSMVEWNPLSVLPPLTDAAWQAAFAHYQKYPGVPRRGRLDGGRGFQGVSAGWSILTVYRAG